MSFSQVLFGQHFHPSTVIIAYFLFDNDDAHTSSNLKVKITSLEAQSRFVSHVLESSSAKRSVKNNKKNLEYTSSVAKAYVKWLEEIYNNDDHKEENYHDEEEDEGLEFDDDLMELTAPSFSHTNMNQEDEEEDDDEGEEEWKTLTFYTSTTTATSTAKTAGDGSTSENRAVDVSRSHQQKMYAKVGPQFVNVGLSLWPASALMSKFVVDEMKKTIMNNSTVTTKSSSSSMTKDETPSNHVYIELGTGIGLTGVYFEKALTLFSSSSSQHRFIMTDYQDIILDLGNTNLKLNRCMNDDNNNNNNTQCNNNTYPAEYRYLHWGELEQNTKFFEKIVKEEQQLQLQQQEEKAAQTKTRTKTIYTICAADVIYDPSAIPDLVQTIDIGLNVLSSSSSSSSFDAEQPILRVIIYHTVRNPRTFELFKELCESKGMHVEMLEIGDESEQDKELNGKLMKIIDTVSASTSSSLVDDDKMTTMRRIKPFLKFPVQRENILRSLQEGKFYNGIFAKMAPQLRKVIVTRKENNKKQ